MKHYLTLNKFLYPVLFLTLILFLAFKKEHHNIHLNNGFYHIEAKVISQKTVKIISPKYLKDEVLSLNIKLPQNAYIRGFIKVKNGVVKTSPDFLEIAKSQKIKSLKDFLKNKFKRTTSNDWSKDIGLALLFGEGTKALPEDLLTAFSVNSLIFLLIMSGIHIDILFKNLSKIFIGEHSEVFGFFILLIYVSIFMEHGAPIVRAMSFLGVNVILKALYRYISPIRLFFVSGIITLLFNMSFYKNVGFWLSMIITFFIILYIENVEIPLSFLRKILFSMEVSLIAIVSSLPIVSKLGPISIEAVLIIPFLLLIVEIYLVFGLLNIITLFSVPVFYVPLNKTAYYFGSVVYALNLHPMYFKIPIYGNIAIELALFTSIMFVKDRYLKIFFMIGLFGVAYMLWSA